MANIGLWMGGTGAVASVRKAAGANTRPASMPLASSVLRAEVRSERLSAE